MLGPLAFAKGIGWQRTWALCNFAKVRWQPIISQRSIPPVSNNIRLGTFHKSRQSLTPDFCRTLSAWARARCTFYILLSTFTHIIAHEYWVLRCIKPFKINGGSIWNWFLQKKTLGLCQHFDQKLLMKKVWSLSKSSAQHSSSSAAFTNPPSSLPTSLCWQ